MGAGRPGSRLAIRTAMLVLLLGGGLVDVLPAHANLSAAVQTYKKGDYPHAFQDFLALARLGQPLAQLNVAYMYYAGQGTRPSAIHAYAWAVLAAENGQARGRKLAKQLLPTLALAPGSRTIAGWIIAAYTPEALDRTLLPAFPKAGPRLKTGGWFGGGLPRIFSIHDPKDCVPTRTRTAAYPPQADQMGIQERLLVRYTVMPDGTARFPRVIFGLPEPSIDAAARTSVLMFKFARLPPGRHSIQCTLEFQFVERDRSAAEYPRLQEYLSHLRREARNDDPRAEALYGTVLAGAPQLEGVRRAVFLWWLVKAAQAGEPLAQYEVGESLQSGFGGCVPDETKALRWLHLAAAQNQADAEVALAVRLLRGAPDAAQMTAARKWLERAVAQGNVAGEMYLSALLAAAPQRALRNPARALRLEQNAYKGVDTAPTGYQIRAAAEAAEGDFTRAVRSEREAIGRARRLGWNLLPLKRRLALYRSGKPWYGNLLGYGSSAIVQADRSASKAPG